MSLKNEPTILKEAFEEGYKNPHQSCPYGDAWGGVGPGAAVAFEFEKGKLERLKDD